MTLRSVGTLLVVWFALCVQTNGRLLRPDGNRGKKASAFLNTKDIGKKTAVFLATKAGLFTSVEFTTLAYEADIAADTPDGLHRVKNLIRDMITQKMANMAESTTEKEFCNSEMPKAKAQLEKLSNEIEKHTADHDKLIAEIAELKDDSADLSSGIAKLHQNVSGEQELRHQQESAYDEKKSVWEHDRRPQTEDMLKLRITYETEEAAARIRFENLQQNNLAGIKQKEETVKRNQVTLVKMAHQVSDSDQDFRFQKELLDSAKIYKEQIDKRCIVGKDTHKERKTRRHEEIESLKDAYTIMGGEGIP